MGNRIKEFEREILNKEITLQELDNITARKLRIKKWGLKIRPYVYNIHETLIDLGQKKGHYTYHVWGNFTLFYLKVFFDVINDSKKSEDIVIKVTEVKKAKDISSIITVLLIIFIVAIIYISITNNKIL